MYREKAPCGHPCPPISEHGIGLPNGYGEYVKRRETVTSGLRTAMPLCSYVSMRKAMSCVTLGKRNYCVESCGETPLAETDSSNPPCRGRLPLLPQNAKSVSLTVKLYHATTGRIQVQFLYTLSGNHAQNNIQFLHLCVK